MDELIGFGFLIGIIFFIVIFVLPIISLVKIIGLSKELRAMQGQMNFLSAKLERFLSRKEDQQQSIIEEIAGLVKARPEPEPVPEVKEEETPLPVITEEVLQPEVPEITEAPLLLEESVPAEPPVAEMPAEEPQIVREIMEPEPEIQPEPAIPVYPFEKKKSGFPDLLWGENLLSKIGIITFVLGIAFFVKYAIDKEWINEIGRVGIGLLVGAAIIGTAHKLRKQYDVFSAILCGGGFAVFYITITLAFREYQLIPQTVAFILLILVTVACVMFSMLYDKKELALFSLLGGFGAPFMVSTGSGNYIVLFSYIFILNCGMIWLAFKKKWQIIGIATFVLSQLVIWVWLATDFKDQFGGASFFLLLFFVQFYALAIADHLRHPGKITPFQAILILWNNLSLFAGWYLIFRDYPADVNGVFTIVLACMNGVVLTLLFRKKDLDKNLVYLVIAIVLSFATLAVPIQLKGNAISMFWAAEMVILLFLWLQSRIQVFRYGLFGVIGLLSISYLMDLANGYTTTLIHSGILPIIINRYFITGVVITVAAAICYYLMKREIILHGVSIEPTDPSVRLYSGFHYSLFVLIFLIPFCEIYYQFHARMPEQDVTMLVSSILLTYTYIYLAIVLFLKKGTMLRSDPGLLIVLAIILVYTVAMIPTLSELREEIFIDQYFARGWFNIHLFSLPAIGYLIYQMFHTILPSQHKEKDNFIWFLVIISVILITCEFDNLAFICTSPFTEYSHLLHDIHTFGYPVLWGILAMGLMIWGLKTKHSILRKISLVFFAFIIVKFYIYDVWRMSQGGRIVSFVLLGLILLLVSFMQQKIRKLVRDEKEEERKEEEEK